MSYAILRGHNADKGDGLMHLRFDSLISHDITYVGIIQTAMASGMTAFPVPYVMTGASDSRFLDRVCDQCVRFLPYKIDEQQLASIHGLDENVDIVSLPLAVDYYKYLMQEV